MNIKDVVVSAVVALVVSLAVTSMVGGNSQPQEISQQAIEQAVGAQWRNPNSDFSAKTLTSTGTSTLNGLLLNTGGSCVNYNATSSASAGKLTASTTSVVNGVSTGVLLFSFGACS